jgi:hypothetical protein
MYLSSFIVHLTGIAQMIVSDCRASELRMPGRPAIGVLYGAFFAVSASALIVTME